MAAQSDRSLSSEAAPRAAGSLADQIAQNVTAIAGLLQQEREKTQTPAQRRLEHLSRLIGQPFYLLTLLSLVAIWILFNELAPLAGLHSFDRAPFPLLQGVLTLIALLTAMLAAAAQHWRVADMRCP